MIRLITALSVVALVASCGGTRYSSSNSASNRAIFKSSNAPSSSALFASGPIATACRKADRKQASRSRCGCVQAVANRSLNAREQSRGASFFNDPQKSQDLRQSDNPANERLWLKWKAFGAEAARVCT